MGDGRLGEIQGCRHRSSGITGFCWGGRITWLYCDHNPQVKAGVAWYGRLVGDVNEFTPRHPTQVAGQLKAPVLGLYGGLDTGIPLETVEAMEKALKGGSAAARLSEIHIYDNAPHAFHADYRASYSKVEAEDGWKRMQAWFSKMKASRLVGLCGASCYAWASRTINPEHDCCRPETRSAR